ASTAPRAERQGRDDREARLMPTPSWAVGFVPLERSARDLVGRKCGWRLRGGSAGGNQSADFLRRTPRTRLPDRPMPIRTIGAGSGTETNSPWVFPSAVM